MRRQSEQPKSPLVARNRPVVSPSAPVDGKAFTTGKTLLMQDNSGRAKCPSCPFRNGCPGQCGWQTPNAASSTREDLSATNGETYPLAHHSGYRRVSDRARRQVGNYEGARPLVGSQVDAGGLV